MKTIATILLGATALYCNFAFANPTNIQQIESAYQIRDGLTLQALQTESKNYSQALTHYRLATVYYFTQKKKNKGIETLKASGNILQDLLKAKPSDPELLALLSGVYGMQIQMEPKKFMNLGHKSSALIAQALEQAPGNPRVQYFYGINKLNAPAMFGGGEMKALEAFSKAVKLFEEGKSGSYDWGEVDALIWQGITLKKMGNSEMARKSWQKALELAPDSRYAKALLEQV